MTSARAPHPFRLWRVAKGYTTDQVARMAARCGCGTKGVYVAHIELGNRRPSSELARALSRLTVGAVPLNVFYDWYDAYGRGQ